MLATVVAAAQDIGVSVDGKKVEFSGQKPASVNGRVLVPLRGVFEQMGAFVQWVPQSQTVTAASGSTNIGLVIGSTTAMVNGKAMTLDVPAQLVNGRTMVPLRFLSEALGAQVLWNETTREVSITTAQAGTGSGSGSGTTTKPLTREVRVNADTVIPVSLNKELGSKTSKAGSKFSATVVMQGDDDYAGLPRKSKIIGEVVASRPKSGKNPGVLEVTFTHIEMPDGVRYPLDGSLIDLESNDVKSVGGVITANPTRKKDQRAVFAGYGAGAGLIVGMLTKKPVEGAIVGGILGYLFGEVDRAKKDPADVVLDKGTKFGVVLNKDLVVKLKDAAK